MMYLRKRNDSGAILEMHAVRSAHYTIVGKSAFIECDSVDSPPHIDGLPPLRFLIDGRYDVLSESGAYLGTMVAA